MTSDAVTVLRNALALPESDRADIAGETELEDWTPSRDRLRGVVYMTLGEEIVVIAVAHDRRLPAYRAARTEPS